MAEENKEIEKQNTADDKKRKIAGLAINVRRSLTYILVIKSLLYLMVFCLSEIFCFFIPFYIFTFFNNRNLNLLYSLFVIIPVYIAVFIINYKILKYIFIKKNTLIRIIIIFISLLSTMSFYIGLVLLRILGF